MAKWEKILLISELKRPSRGRPGGSTRYRGTDEKVGQEPLDPELGEEEEGEGEIY